MEEILMKLKKVLKENDATCVIGNEEEIYISNQKGIKPLLQFVSEGKIGYYAADKVVGKAAAYLHILLKTKGIYAEIISEKAIEIFNQNGITFYYQEKVENIMNKYKTDICPMEKAVSEVNSAKEAYDKLIKVIESLKNNSTH